MRTHYLLVAGIAVLALEMLSTADLLGFRARSSVTQTSTAAISPTFAVKAAVAPSGLDGLTVRWIDVSAPAQGTMRAAIATPAGRPPFQRFSFFTEPMASRESTSSLP